MKTCHNSPILVSSCLLGISSRYDGRAKPDPNIISLIKEIVLIPICPEQLGGLPTPREPAEISGNRVITKSGIDVTKNCINGAKEALKIAKLLGIKLAILKQYSPSCGCGKIYDGTFRKKVIKGDGITTRLFKKEGILVVSEEQLDLFNNEVKG